jgi:polo-like kinase 4
MRVAHLTKRVANEVEIHWQLRHTSILELYNYFEDSEYVYMVMELCDNGNFYQYLKKHKNGLLDEDEARGVVYQLVNGLLYLHSNGIIHRDLKLSNLLLNHKFELVSTTFSFFD